MRIEGFFLYLLVMFGVTYAVRVIPFVLFQKKIENRFVRSFLAYIPYTVLGAMTFPAVLYAAGSIISAAAGAAAALVLAYRGKGLFTVAVSASLTAFLVSFFLEWII